MSEDTTISEQLAEIEPQPQPEPQPEPQATQYTPPEGWRLLEFGETLQEGDVSVRADGHWCPTERVGSTVGTKQRYIRRIEPQPEEQPEPQADTVQVREGRWKTRDGKIVQVVPTDEARERDRNNGWLWMGAAASESDYWHADGTWLPARAPHDNDLVEYLGPIESQPEPQPQAADTADELRSEVSYVQNLLGESRQRVTQLEELVTSLRTINTAQEKAFVDAGKANDKHVDTIGQMQRELQQQHRELQKRALRIFDLDTINAAQEKAFDAVCKENTALQGEAHDLNMEIGGLQRQLAVAKEELTIAAAVSQQLQIELDAAQQVLADSPELRQLRSDLAEVTRDRDEYRHAHGLLVQGIDAGHERTRAETVEAIIEWLQPFRGCNSPALALLLIEALPDIMRSLTGLADEDVE